VSGRRAALAALLAACVSACAVAPHERELATVDPAALSSFELNGRISLRLPKESFPGRVRWQHAPAIDELWFYSPVGSTVAHLRRDADGALLVTAQGREYRAQDLRQLAFEVLGWDLPLEGLPFWVRGLPWPQASAPSEERDAQGRLTRLTQAGWQVAYLDWSPAGVRGLPSKLDLQGERLRIRLVVERWSVDVDPR
jgi:outer membrane lipoprotein LolB